MQGKMSRMVGTPWFHQRGGITISPIPSEIIAQQMAACR
jgi:hypothetical protein